MKLTRKHIGQLFDIAGSDGSWVYQLVDVKGDELLFYNMHSGYEIQSNKHKDWQRFKPTKPWPKSWIGYGWEGGRREK